MKSESNINIILTNEYFEPGFQKLKDSGLNTFHFPMIKTKSAINEIKINLVGKANLIFFSNDTLVSPIIKFWNIKKSIRLDRFFKSL